MVWSTSKVLGPKTSTADCHAAADLEPDLDAHIPVRSSPRRLWARLVANRYTGYSHFPWYRSSIMFSMEQKYSVLILALVCITFGNRFQC